MKWIQRDDKKQLWFAYREARQAMAEAYEELPAEVVAAAYQFKALLLMARGGDIDETFSLSLSEHYGYDSVIRKFTIRVFHEARSGYGDSTQIYNLFTVTEENEVLNFDKTHELPWERKP